MDTLKIVREIISFDELCIKILLFALIIEELFLICTIIKHKKQYSLISFICCLLVALFFAGLIILLIGYITF